MGATDSLLGDPAGICVDPFDTIYFCDYAHGAIRAISPEGSVSVQSVSQSAFVPWFSALSCMWVTQSP